jgi:hypothetical protein
LGRFSGHVRRMLLKIPIATEHTVSVYISQV